MPSTDKHESASSPVEETCGPTDRRQDTRGMGPLVYELFVLGELMVQPMYGYHLHEIANRILGPLRPLSWGIIYPLIRRLEQEGLTTSAIERRRQGFPRTERGQPRRIYAITPTGRERFLALMLTPSEYSRDTPEVFVIKLTKFQFLTSAQRQGVLQWYRSYLRDLRTYYQEARSEILRNPEIAQEERPWIVQSVDYRLHALDADLSWLDSQIADVHGGEQAPA